MMSEVDTDDRAFKRGLKFNTNNGAIPAYGESILFYSLNTTAIGGLVKCWQVVSMTVKFHKFDGIATVARKRIKNRIT